MAKKKKENPQDGKKKYHVQVELQEEVFKEGKKKLVDLGTTWQQYLSAAITKLISGEHQ